MRELLRKLRKSAELYKQKALGSAGTLSEGGHGEHHEDKIILTQIGPFDKAVIINGSYST